MTPDIERALGGLCPDWNLHDVEVDAFLWGGYSNKNYKVRHNKEPFVLRLPASTSTSDFATEYAMLRVLAQVFSEPGNDPPSQNLAHSNLAELVAAEPAHGWLLSRWVDAPVLASINGVTGAQLGGYLATLHAQLEQASRLFGKLIAAPPATRLVTSIVADFQRVVDHRDCLEKLRGHLQTLTASADVSRLCHIDLNPWNVLCDQTPSPAVWTTLDWETLASAPALFDLVALSDGYAYNQGYSAADTHALAEKTLQSYCSASGQKPNLVALGEMRKLFWWREYAWAAARLTSADLSAAVLADVRNQRRDYAVLLAPEAAALGLPLP